MPPVPYNARGSTCTDVPPPVQLDSHAGLGSMMLDIPENLYADEMRMASKRKWLITCVDDE